MQELLPISAAPRRVLLFKHGDRACLWDDRAFCARVERLAEERGSSMSKVCRRAGLSASYLAKPAGRSGRSIEAILRIARELDVNVMELIGGTSTHQRHDLLPTDEMLNHLALTFDIMAQILRGMSTGGR
jgi:transcriptional regulator with XRE-family HTH domain